MSRAEIYEAIRRCGLAFHIPRVEEIQELRAFQYPKALDVPKPVMRDYRLDSGELA